MNCERVKLVKGDITKLEIKAIVNAANSSLMGGGGVDGAIHRAGGPIIHEECMRVISKIGRCETGESVITSAGRMPSKFVIHTVGPVWKDGTKNEKVLLANCYKNSLSLAKEFEIDEIAFPNISTGIYGFPKELAADISIENVCNILAKDLFFKEVVFVCFDEENFQLYEERLNG